MTTATTRDPTPERPTPGILTPAPHPRRLAVSAAVVVVLLAVAGLLLRSHPVDAGLAQALNRWHVGLLGTLSTGVYTVFEPVPAILLTVVVTAVVWVHSRQLRVAVAFAGVVALTWIPSAVLKVVVARPRPDAALLSHPFTPAQVDASYPSGHVAFVTALVLAVLFLARGTRWSRVVAVVGTVLIAAVAIALGIDAVHWPTDVLASVAWSVAVAPLARMVWVDVVARLGARREQTGRHRVGSGRDAS